MEGFALKPIVSFPGFDDGDLSLVAPKTRRPMPKSGPLRSPGPPNRMSAFDLRAIDAKTQTLTQASARADGRTRDLLRSCLLPRGAIATPSERVLVGCFGESVVLVLDPKADRPTVLATIETSRGPAALGQVDEESVLVWSSLAREAALVSPAAVGNAARIASTAIARVRELDPVALRGRELFHRTGDVRISEDGLACASCHPDGRDDGLVWQSPRGPRRTRTLAGNASRAATFGWGGEHATIDAHVTETLERLRGKGLPQEDRDAIYAYLRTMAPVPPASRPDDPSTHRGAQLFASDRSLCATCHDPSSGFTDHATHDIGGERVVTPSLLGVGARGTLFHDGRYASLASMLEGDDGMGGLRRLTADEKRDLAAFLRTL